jgi:hypothetical protein
MQQSYPRLQYATFLTNHDMDRIFTQFGNNTTKMKLAAALYLTMPGIPVIYYGEELGMPGSGAHENIRRPMQWTNGTYGGFSTRTPWYGLGNNYATNNVSSMDGDPNSLLRHYKKLIHIRNDQVALRQGYLLNVNNTQTDVLTYARIAEKDAVIIMSNLGVSSSNSSISLPISSLPAGTYFVTELYHNEAMGTITIDPNGGFSSWQATGKALGAHETWMLLLSLDNPVSISEGLDNGLSFSLFPNPASEQVHVEMKRPAHGLVEIFDPSGKSLIQYQLSQGQVTIPTGHLPVGMYFIKVMVDGNTKIERLLVIR